MKLYIVSVPFLNHGDADEFKQKITIAGIPPDMIGIRKIDSEDYEDELGNSL